MHIRTGKTPAQMQYGNFTERTFSHEGIVQIKVMDKRWRVIVQLWKETYENNMIKE